MESPNVKKIQNYLLENGGEFIASVRQNPISEAIVLLVFESSLSETNIAGKVTRRKLSFLKKDIAEKLQINVEILVSKGEDHEKLEAGLTALLKHRFPNAIQDCFVSSLDSTFADAWIAGASKESISNKKLQHELKEVILEYLKLFGITLRQLHFGDDSSNVPSPVMILKAIKVAAPVNIHDLEKILRTKNVTLPSASWLRGKLDSLRKQGLILWRQDGQYLMTSAGLGVIPHTKSRTSSDVQRALALGRRKW